MAPSDYEHPIDPSPGQTAVIQAAAPRTAAQLRADAALIDAAATGDIAGVRAAIGSPEFDPGRLDASMALGGAAVEGHVEIIELLVGAGVSSELAIRGTTLTAQVALSDETGLGLQTLLDLGAEPAGPAAYGFTPLHLSAMSDVTWLNSWFLLRAGADPDVRAGPDAPPYEMRRSPFNEEAPGRLEGRFDRRGATPLMMAALMHNPENVRVLLASGADATLTNGDGQTALDLARAVECSECAAVLDGSEEVESADELVYGQLRRELYIYAKFDKIRAIVQSGIDVNRVDEDGEAPIHWLAGDARHRSAAGRNRRSTAWRRRRSRCARRVW